MKLNRNLIHAGCLLSFFLAFPALADEVILDDLIVDGSMCVGVECVNGEDFLFDTLKLKSDNPQIRFVDTSTSSAFPTHSWTLGVADDLTGAASVFFVNDAEADAPVLQMSSGADGGIALGADSTLEDNAISVGSAGSERRVAYVAAGTAATDAVNLGQFDQFKLDAADAVDEQLEVLINEVAARVDELIARLDALNP